jgi:hypothetical protein
MTPEEINEGLLKEFALYRETDAVSPELKRLLMDLILQVSYGRYKNMNENLRILCESEAYIHCCKNSVYFNPNKTNKARAYVVTIIRCSFASTVVKEIHFK